MPPTPIQAPAGYLSSHAAAFADLDGNAVVVSAANPLPVSARSSAAAPLVGTTSTSGVFGPFQPATDRPAMLALSGNWAGSVRVTRSTDNGATRLPLTVGGAAWGQYTANCCEAVWDEADSAARLYLEVTLSSGSLTYRLAQ